MKFASSLSLRILKQSLPSIYTLVSIGGLGFQAHSQHTFFSRVATTLETGRDQWLWLRHANHFYTSKIGEQSDRMPSKTWPKLPIKIMSFFHFINKNTLLLWPSAPANVGHIQGINLRDAANTCNVWVCLKVSDPYKLERSPIYQFPADVWKVFQCWDIPRVTPASSVVSSFFLGLSPNWTAFDWIRAQANQLKLLGGIMSQLVALYHPIVKLSFNNFFMVLSHNFGVFVVETYLSTCQVNMDPFSPGRSARRNLFGNFLTTNFLLVHSKVTDSNTGKSFVQKKVTQDCKKCETLVKYFCLNIKHHQSATERGWC